MLSTQDRQIAQRFKKRLKEDVHILDFRVFGSRARGDARPDSDLDIFIKVAEITPQLRQQISEIAWEVGFAADRVINTVVVTPTELETGPMGATSLVANAQNEGVTI